MTKEDLKKYHDLGYKIRVEGRPLGFTDTTMVTEFVYDPDTGEDIDNRTVCMYVGPSSIEETKRRYTGWKKACWHEEVEEVEYLNWISSTQKYPIETTVDKEEIDLENYPMVEQPRSKNKWAKLFAEARTPEERREIQKRKIEEHKQKIYKETYGEIVLKAAEKLDKVYYAFDVVEFLNGFINYMNNLNIKDFVDRYSELKNSSTDDIDGEDELLSTDFKVGGVVDERTNRT